MMKLQCALWTDRSRWCLSTTKAVMASKPKLFNARHFQAADWRSYFRLWHIEIIGGRSPPFQSLLATNPSLEKHSTSRSSGESISCTKAFTILINRQDQSKNIRDKTVLKNQSSLMLMAAYKNIFFLLQTQCILILMCHCVCVCVVWVFFFAGVCRACDFIIAIGGFEFNSIDTAAILLNVSWGDSYRGSSAAIGILTTQHCRPQCSLQPWSPSRCQPCSCICPLEYYCDCKYGTQLKLLKQTDGQIWYPIETP